MSRSTQPFHSARPLPVLVALAALVATLLTALAGSPAAAADKNCSDFPSQKAAQLFYLRHGGPHRDPHGLDADDDGVACDSNPPPRYTKPTLPGKPGKPKPAPRPPKVIDSSISLKVSHARRIAGERFSLTIKVRPAARRTVVLQGKVRGGSWTRLAKATTNRKGRLVLESRATSVDAKYRAVAPARRDGRKRWTKATSRAKLLDTVAQFVTLELPDTASTGDQVTAVVRSTPARRWRPVALQVRNAGRWRTVAEGLLNRRGVERWTLTRPEGTHRMRAIVGRYLGAKRATSDLEVLTVTTPDTMPPAPTGLSATAGNAEVALTWDEVAGATDYVVLYRASSEADWSDGPVVTEPTATVADLTNGTEYTFAVRAVDGDGDVSPESTSVTATPAGPPA
jgi:hypothetical protein